MNDASRIKSIVIEKFIAEGGELESLQTLRGYHVDRDVHVFTVQGREGTYTCDNAGVMWWDASPQEVIEFLQVGGNEIGRCCVARI